ncbi:MAG: hypothetical protein OXC95_10235 [Dehalococcoidia bacterium]|nr:hypothetical protein [Dehalococcoidia bacterium]
MARTDERTRPARDSFLSVQAPWWPLTFWLFIGQLVWEAAMVVLDERSRLSAMGLVEQARFVRSEIADDILISVVIAIALVDIWRYTLITAGWFKELVDRNIESHREKLRDEGRDEVLAVLDEDMRKEAERRLRRNGSSDSKD